MTLTPETLGEDIPKSIIYPTTPELCAKFVSQLRMCLPIHLCTAVHHVSAGVSNKAKEVMWNLNREGVIHILVSTEATALGCNDQHIKYCFVFLASIDLRSLSVLV